MRPQILKWETASPSACLPASYTKQIDVNNGDNLEANIDASGEMHLVPSAPKVDKAAMLKKKQYQ